MYGFITFLCAKLFHEKMQEKLQVCECSETWHTWYQDIIFKRF